MCGIPKIGIMSLCAKVKKLSVGNYLSNNARPPHVIEECTIRIMVCENLVLKNPFLVLPDFSRASDDELRIANIGENHSSALSLKLPIRKFLLGIHMA
jgi:hypothetical protein